MVVLERVSRTYAGPRPVEALRSCDLVIRHGDFIAIMGPSGSGKSTLLNLLGLLDAPSGGRYWLEGFDVSKLRDDKRTELRGQQIGFVFQQFHLLLYRSALENVEIGMTYGGTPRSERQSRARLALGRVGLQDRSHALPPTLSGGERQRVAIARALVNHPTFVLCDEPTGNLDSVSSSHILALLGDLNSEGVTLVVVTHDEDVASKAKRTISIVDGVVSEGPNLRSVHDDGHR